MPPSFANDELPRSKSGHTALVVCATAARRAGALALERFRTDVEVSLKGRANVVTDADLASERVILDYVTAEYPEFGVLSEESAPVPGSAPYTWVIDPIDGTRNFAEGIPHFCVVVAIAEGDNVAAGVTYDPVRDELFAAQLRYRHRHDSELRQGIGPRRSDCAAGCQLPRIQRFYPRLRRPGCPF